MSTITQVVTVTTSQSNQFRSESTHESTWSGLFDILEKYESCNDPDSIRWAQRAIASFNKQESAEAAIHLVILTAELQNQNSPFARELQAWLDGLPPEVTANVDPIDVMSQLLHEQSEIRLNSERRMQTIFVIFKENLRESEVKLQAETAELLRGHAAQINEHKESHARDLQNIQATHLLARDLDAIRFNDMSTRFNNEQNIRSQMQQEVSTLRSQVSSLQSHSVQMQQQLAQPPKKKHGISFNRF